MRHLKLLGAVHLEDGNGVVSGPAAQRHRLALLALLAAARPDGLPRERLMALLWPEADADRARRLLNQAVYVLRRALGDEAVETSGDGVRLAAPDLTDDLSAFRQAVEAREDRLAVDRYGGAFLDGFFLPGAQEFEEWTERTRRELVRSFRSALRRLAEARALEGDARAAARWWHRLVEDDPHSGPAVLGLMQALEAIGDRAAAIRVGLGHGERLQADFGAEPDPDVAALIEEIRSGRRAPPSERDRLPDEGKPASDRPADTANPTPVGSEPAPRHAPARDPGPVRNEPPSTGGDRPGDPTPEAGVSIGLRGRGRALWWVLAPVGLAAVLMLGLLLRGRPAPGEGSPTVAVLPFVNLSPEPDSAYLSDGITEELIGTLSGIDGLQVASRTAVFAIDASTLDPAEIGARLGVDHLVEGSVRRSAGRLRVQATLVGVSDGFPIWSTRFDAPAEDVFAVQDSIARAVARALEVRFADPSRELRPTGGTRDHRAQDLYFRGRYAWNRRTRDGLERAVADFDSAVALDPRYARALTGLGDAWAVLGFYDYRSPDEAFPRAQAAARRALAVDPTLAEPHATLGYASLYHDFRWEEAESHFQRSIALDPGYPVARQWYANFLTAQGRFEEARREMRLASELDPLSMIAYTAIGWVSYYAGDFETAIEELAAAAQRDPEFMLAHLFGAKALAGAGRLPDARTAALEAVDLSGGSAIARAALARILGQMGDIGGARGVLLELEGEGAYVPSYEIACAWVGVGELDLALDWLERAMSERAHSLALLRVDPELVPLHGHPRFEALLSDLDL